MLAQYQQRVRLVLVCYVVCVMCKNKLFKTYQYVYIYIYILIQMICYILIAVNKKEFLHALETIKFITN